MLIRPNIPIGRRHFFVRFVLGLSVVAGDAGIVLYVLNEVQAGRALEQIGTRELAMGAVIALSFIFAMAFLENAAAARCVDLGLSRNVYLFSKNRRGNVLLQLIFAPGNRRR